MSGYQQTNRNDNDDEQYEEDSADVISFTSDKSYGKIYIGDKDSAAFLQLRSRNCTSVVNCQSNMPLVSKEKDVKYLNCDPELTSNSFEAAFDFIDRTIAGGENITVLCQTGLGSSAAVVIYYLMRKMQCSLAESHKLLTDARKNKTLNIKPVYVNALIAHERKLFGRVTVALSGRKIVYLDKLTRERVANSKFSASATDYGNNSFGTMNNRKEEFSYFHLFVLLAMLTVLYGILLSTYLEGAGGKRK